MSISSIIDTVSALLAMLLTGIASQVCVDVSSCGKVDLRKNISPLYLFKLRRVNKLTRVEQDRDAHPIAVPGAPQAGYSIDVFYVALSTKGAALVEAGRVNSVYSAAVLQNGDGPPMHFLQQIGS